MPQPLRNGIDLFREGAGEPGAVWDGFRSSRIVSLYEIVKPFYLGRYLRVLNAFGDLYHQLEQAGNRIESETLRGLLPNTLAAFETLKTDCENLELAASFSTAEKVLAFFKNEPLKSEHLKKLIDEFRGA